MHLCHCVLEFYFKPSNREPFPFIFLNDKNLSVIMVFECWKFKNLLVFVLIILLSVIVMLSTDVISIGFWQDQMNQSFLLCEYCCHPCHPTGKGGGGSNFAWPRSLEP